MLLHVPWGYTPSKDLTELKSLPPPLVRTAKKPKKREKRR